MPVYMAPAGAGIGGFPEGWTPMGYISEDGFDLSPAPESGCDPDPWNITGAVITEVHFYHRGWSKDAFRLFFPGVYRLPGGKPLIHKGGKP